MPTEDERLAVEANRLYWGSDAAVGEIAERLGLSRRAVYRVLRPEPAGGACVECGAGLVFATRSARSAGEVTCPGCGAERDSALLRAAERGADIGGDGAGTQPESGSAVEPAWTASAHAPLDTDASALRSRALFIGGAALAGVVVGAAVALAISRR